MKYIVSYGAGLNSTSMLVYLVENKKPLDMVMFADIGDEHQRTYDSLEYYKKYCVDNNIPFLTVSSIQYYRDKFKKEGFDYWNKINTMYDYYYYRKITPNRRSRDCTLKFKILPIRKTLRKLFPKETFTMYLGIDYDEVHRMKTSDVKYISHAYPLIDVKLG